MMIMCQIRLFFFCSSGMFVVKVVYSLTKVTPSPSTVYSSVQMANGLCQLAVTQPLRYMYSSIYIAMPLQCTSAMYVYDALIIACTECVYASKVLANIQCTYQGMSRNAIKCPQNSKFLCVHYLILVTTP